MPFLHVSMNIQCCLFQHLFPASLTSPPRSPQNQPLKACQLQRNLLSPIRICWWDHLNHLLCLRDHQWRHRRWCPLSNSNRPYSLAQPQACLLLGLLLVANRQQHTCHQLRPRSLNSQWRPSRWCLRRWALIRCRLFNQRMLNRQQCSKWWVDSQWDQCKPARQTLDLDLVSLKTRAWVRLGKTSKVWTST